MAVVNATIVVNCARNSVMYASLGDPGLRRITKTELLAVSAAATVPVTEEIEYPSHAERLLCAKSPRRRPPEH